MNTEVRNCVLWSLLAQALILGGGLYVIDEFFNDYHDREWITVGLVILVVLAGDLTTTAIIKMQERSNDNEE